MSSAPEDVLQRTEEQNPTYCYTNDACEEDPSLSVAVRSSTNGEAQGPRQSYDRDDGVSTKDKSVFLPGYAIGIHVRGFTKAPTRFGNVITYQISVSHAGYHWTIFRGYEQIHAIFLNLYFYDASGQWKGNDSSRHEYVTVESTEQPFPIIPTKLLDPSKEEEEAHCIVMENALRELFRHPHLREYAATLRFLEVSRFSFHGVGIDEEKIRELAVAKLRCLLRDYLSYSCNHDTTACQIFSTWHNRWIVILETCYFYVDLKSGTMSCMFLFDQKCKVERLTRRPLGLLVKHAMKDLVLKFPNKLELERWLTHYETTAATTALDFTKVQPHGSFSPVRENIPARWFINGAPHMSAVAEILETAKEEIFIGGWWISPEVFLKRPVEENKKWRLDYVLKRMADSGVKIYILAYKESRLALGINSWYSKKKLMKMSPNIIVKRHPDNNVVLWSHHDKIVVVDQKIAFVGGIDLCYGRWDDHLHRISDLSPTMMQDEVQSDGKFDTRKLRGSSFRKPAKKASHHTRLAIGNALVAPWRYTKAKLYHPRHKSRTRFSHNMRQYKKKMIGKNSAVYKAMPAWKKITRTDSTVSNLNGLSDGMRGCLWLGKDYINEVKVAFSQPNDGKPFEDLLDRTEIPRLPWHDASTVITGYAAQDVARHFIQKWNACKMQKFRFDEQGPFLLPKHYGPADQQDVELPWETQRCSVQVIRSTASWSGGLLPHHVETSIQQSYIDLIRESKHYVYLESQFFITLVGNHKRVENKVGDAIFERVMRAHKNGEVFRMFVNIPLQPAIAGDYGTRAGSAVQAVTHFIYQSISRGKDSLMESLRRAGCDPSKYLSFCGLRQFGMIGGKLGTEIVYVHSKLMIVDDVYTIIGSANMNDRSMVGSRDSEIGLLLHDTEFDDSIMDGKPYKSGKFSGRLRKRLMQIHLGLAEDMDFAVSREEADRIVSDPVCDEFYRGWWIKTAVQNEAIFEEVFAPTPTDKVFSFRELKKWQKVKPLCVTDPEQAKERLKNVRGYLSKFPLKFLKDSRLKPHIDTAAGLLPLINWT